MPAYVKCIKCGSGNWASICTWSRKVSVCMWVPEVPLHFCVHLLFVCVYMSVCLNVAGRNYELSRKGWLLLPLGVDISVQREVCFWRPRLCLHMVEGLKCWMACKACMWHRRSKAGRDPSPTKWRGCATVQHWLCCMTQEYVGPAAHGAKLPWSLSETPFSSVLTPFQTCWDSFC